MTLADVPGLPVVVVPTLTVAALPVAPVGPVFPRGIVKSKTAADEEPELVTEALVPGLPVEVVPTEIVAADPVAPVTDAPVGPGTVESAPVAPVGPGTVEAAPVLPCGPVIPRGIVKSKTAAELVPEFVTDADEPGSPVDVVPTLTEAA